MTASVAGRASLWLLRSRGGVAWALLCAGLASRAGAVECLKTRYALEVDGAKVLVNCGALDGVENSMGGTLRPPERPDVRLARFVCEQVDTVETWLKVLDKAPGFDPYQEMVAVFDPPLVMPGERHEVLSVDVDKATLIIDAGCRSGLPSGRVEGEIIRTLREGDLTQIDTVATFDVIRSDAFTSLATWKSAGPGYRPVPGEHQAVFRGATEATDSWLVTEGSDSIAAGQRIRVTVSGVQPGRTLALLQRHPSGEGEQQFGWAIIRSVQGSEAVAEVQAILPGIQPGSLAGQPMLAIPDDIAVCPGRAAGDWDQAAMLQMRIDDLNRQRDRLEETRLRERQELADQVLDLRRQREALAQAMQAQPPTRAPEPAARRTVAPAGPLLAVAPADEAMVVDADWLEWAASQHCRNRDLAVKIQARTESGNEISMQEQVGQGERGRMRVGEVVDRLRGQMKKRERLRGFQWWVINMKTPKAKDDCQTEHRSVILANEVVKR